jgi:hypothetical protein
MSDSDESDGMRFAEADLRSASGRERSHADPSIAEWDAHSYASPTEDEARHASISPHSDDDNGFEDLSAFGSKADGAMAESGEFGDDRQRAPLVSRQSSSRPKSTPRRAWSEEDNMRVSQTEYALEVHEKSHISSRNRFSRENVSQRVQHDFDNKCTFQPQITKTVRKNTKTAVPRPLPARIEQWSRDSHKRLLSAVEHKQKLEQDELRHCTFRPKITALPKPKQIRKPGFAEDQSCLSENAEDWSKRLYDEAREQQARREQLSKEALANDLKPCRFAPEISEKSRKIAQKVRGDKPVFERLNDVGKQQRLAVQRARAEEEKEATFRPPKLSARSEQLAARARKEMELGEASGRVTSKIRRRADAVRQAEAEYSFAPTINSTSALLAHSSTVFQKSSNFVERQKLLEENKQRKALARAHALQSKEAQELVFRPHIGNADEVLAHATTQPSRTGETDEDRFKRLSTLDKPRAVKAAEEKGEEHTFRPQIDENSKRLAQFKPSLVREYSEVREAQRQQRAEDERQRLLEFQQQHPFKPTLSAGSRAILQSSGAGDRAVIDFERPDAMANKIEAQKKHREQRLEAARRELELRELEQCPFVPELASTKPVPQPSQPVEVRGMARFMELKQIKAQQEASKKEREKEVFGHGERHMASRGYTVPKPFRLSTGPKSAKKQQAQQLIMDEAMKECSFRPQTHEARNRALLKRILAQDAELSDNDDDHHKRDRSEPPTEEYDASEQEGADDYEDHYIYNEHNHHEPHESKQRGDHLRGKNSAWSESYRTASEESDEPHSDPTHTERGRHSRLGGNRPSSRSMRHSPPEPRRDESAVRRAQSQSFSR